MSDGKLLGGSHAIFYSKRTYDILGTSPNTLLGKVWGGYCKQIAK